MSTQSEIQIDLDERPAVQFTESQRIVYQKMVGIISYFFTRASKIHLQPFRGFLLEGPPASGKTEVALQVAKTIRLRLLRRTPPYKVGLRFIDSSVVAAPHWGEAERKLAEKFEINSGDEDKQILLVDDIDCLMITRGSDIAKEWHYSINSVIFHRLDTLDATKAIVIATTNRPDLVDEALRSRLYSLQIPYPQREEIISIAQRIATNLGLGEDASKVASIVTQRLEKIDKPTLRHIQHLIIEECIESGIWSARL